MSGVKTLTPEKGHWETGLGPEGRSPAASIGLLTAKRVPNFCFPRKREYAQRTGRSERFFPLLALLLREKGAVADCGVVTAARIHHRNLQGRARTLSGDSQSRRGAQSLPLSGSSLLMLP